MDGEVFYDDEIKDAVRMTSQNVKMAPEVKKEVQEFDKFMSECEACLNRKDHILKL